MYYIACCLERFVSLQNFYSSTNFQIFQLPLTRLRFVTFSPCLNNLSACFHNQSVSACWFKRPSREREVDLCQRAIKPRPRNVALHETISRAVEEKFSEFAPCGNYGWTTEGKGSLTTVEGTRCFPTEEVYSRACNLEQLRVVCAPPIGQSLYLRRKRHCVSLLVSSLCVHA